MKREGGIREIRVKPICPSMLGVSQDRLPMLFCRSLVVIAFSLAGLVQASSPYGEMTDEELTALTATFDDLSQEERRALLTEVRLRMASSRSEHPVIQIKSERRYGRVIQHPDGSVVHIETREQIVHYRRAPEEADEQHAFGVGFEHRLAELEAQDAEHEEMAAEATPKEPAAGPPTLPVIRANTGKP
jgi:hypothetical protein